jgi:RES domain-containing protein
MREFKSYRSYWDFAMSVTNRWRYVQSPDQAAFLETVLSTSADKEEVLPAGSLLWRAQIGHDWREEHLGEGVREELPVPFSPERMKPRIDRALDSRANPKGIPCLYLATHEATAVAEVRPWVGALVSVAQLETSPVLRVMNCTTDEHRTMIYFVEPDAKERERAVWQDIDKAFSRPVEISDDVASYAPTQIMAEFFRQNGFDGVAYRSSLGPGHNIALFDLDAADVINCSLVEIAGLKLEYGQAANPYFVAKHYPKPAADAT